MKKSVKRTLFLAFAALVACALCALYFSPKGETGEPKAGGRSSRIADAGRRVRSGAHGNVDREQDGDGETEAEEDCVVADMPEERTEEEKLADEEEALVNAFDDLTDTFRESEDDREISMDEVKKFHEQFRKVPKPRKEECLQRALNLLPDDNIMLLAGILMDKEEDKELVELVFNDILNREDGMKQVLLNQIYKDKTHPCWADAAWILDVTGKSGKSGGEAAGAEASGGDGDAANEADE